jgi:hypothetical protein
MAFATRYAGEKYTPTSIASFVLRNDSHYSFIREYVFLQRLGLQGFRNLRVQASNAGPRSNVAFAVVLVLAKLAGVEAFTS